MIMNGKVMTYCIVMFKSYKCTFNMRKLKFRKLMAEKMKKVGSHSLKFICLVHL